MTQNPYADTEAYHAIVARVEPPLTCPHGRTFAEPCDTCDEEESEA